MMYTPFDATDLSFDKMVHSSWGQRREMKKRYKEILHRIVLLLMTNKVVQNCWPSAQLGETVAGIFCITLQSSGIVSACPVSILYCIVEFRHCICLPCQYESCDTFNLMVD